jgi:hypothetical protein
MVYLFPLRSQRVRPYPPPAPRARPFLLATRAPFHIVPISSASFARPITFQKNPAPSRHPIPPPSPIPAPVARRPLRAAARPSTPLPPPSRGDLRVWDRHIRNNADWDLCVARGVVQDRRRLRSPPLSSTTATHRAVRSTKP